MTQEQLDQILAAIGAVRRDLEDDHLDLVKRFERAEAAIADASRRVSSVEQAVIRLINMLPLRAA